MEALSKVSFLAAFEGPHGTRAELNDLASNTALVPWQVYLVTDEGGRIVVATSTDEYTDIALLGEAQAADVAAATALAAAQAAAQAAPVSGTPGTGNATLAAPALGLFGFQLRKNMCGLFLFRDGSAWEIRWGFWTGTAVTRPSAGFVSSSTGSGLTLTSAATVTYLSGANLFGRERSEAASGVLPAWNSNTLGNFGQQNYGATGTLANLNPANTNRLTLQPAVQYTSATTANTGSGVTIGSQTHIDAGFHFSARFGFTQLPTAPRFAARMINGPGSNLTGQPSSSSNYVGFIKDSGDTNIQFQRVSGSKVDTGIALATNVLYEVNIWCEPGAFGAIQALLIDYENQTLFYGTVSVSGIIAASTNLGPHVCCALNGSDTGTAVIMRFGGLFFRSGV